jgi:class 3 adenylate cyclase/DNA-binding NarL/FixJ family response regulator
VGTTTILVTDLPASTEMLTREGDDAGAAALTTHIRLSTDIIERHGGRVAKTLGDGVMALFDSAFGAMRAAVALQQAVAKTGTDRLRIGGNVGEVVEVVDETAEDVFGAAVVIAHRVCAQAEPGQILTTDIVRMLVGGRGDITFSPVGAVELKGFDAPIDVCEVQWSPLPDEVRYRVVVADDAPLVRSGVVRLLADEGFDVVGEADDGASLLRLVEEHAPDLVVTDIRMPPTQTDEGLRAAAEIRAAHPGVAVLVLSQYVEGRAAAGLLDDAAAGVGYLLKERVGELDEFVAACRTIASGGRVVDPLVAEQLLRVGRAGARRRHRPGRAS